MPLKKVYRRQPNRRGYKSIGPRGYVGTQKLAAYKRKSRRYLSSKRHFKKRVIDAVNDQLLEKAQYQVTNSKRINVAVGSQNYDFVLEQNSYSDLNAIQQNIVTPVTGGQPSPSLVTMKFTVCTYFANILMKNQTNTSVIVDMYTFLPRYDNTNNINTQFQTGINTEQKLSNGDITYGVTPYMSNRLTSLNRIIQKKRYVLAPGACEIVEFIDKKNYEISNERIAYNGGTTLHYKGLTKIFWCIVRGEPENDSATKSNVSTAPCAVDFVTTETYYYTWAPLNVVSTQASGTFGAIATGNSVLIDTGATVTPASS